MYLDALDLAQEYTSPIWVFRVATATIDGFGIHMRRSGTSDKARNLVD